MKMLDYEMKKTDDLLYRMIPKPVAKRLRKGEPAVNTCEVWIVATIYICIYVYILYIARNSLTLIAPKNNRDNLFFCCFPKHPFKIAEN